MTNEAVKADDVVAFAPIGDLHLTDAKQRNVADLLPKAVMHATRAEPKRAARLMTACHRAPIRCPGT